MTIALTLSSLSGEECCLDLFWDPLPFLNEEYPTCILYGFPAQSMRPLHLCPLTHSCVYGDGSLPQRLQY